MDLLDKFESKFDPGVFHYNKASILAQKESLVGARYHYELAIENGYSSPDLKNGLNSVREALQVVDAEKPETLTDYFNYGLINIPSEFFITTVLLIFLLIIVGFKNLIWKIKVGLLVLVMTPVALVSYYYNNIDIVILRKDQVVRVGPSKIFEESQIMPKGMKAILGKRYSNYVEVIYPSTYSGWILNKDHVALRK